MALELVPEMALELVPEMALELVPEMALELVPEMALELVPEMALELVPEMALELVPEMDCGSFQVASFQVAAWFARTDLETRQERAWRRAPLPREQRPS
jgi:hypothetical protein